MKKRVIFTSIMREPYFDLWLRYYKRFFDDIFVLRMSIDADKSIEDAKKKHNFIEILDYRGVGMNYEQEAGVMSEFQNKLIKEYETVVYAQGDEFLVPDLREFKDLGDFLEQNKEDVYRCQGWNICHMKDEELSLDLDKPIVKQRKYWWYEKGYNKPLITKIPVKWYWGMHKLWGEDDGILDKFKDSKVYLVHLKQTDYHIFIARLKENNNMDWFSKGTDNKLEIPNFLKEAF